MNNQDKYKFVRGRVSVVDAKALSFDRALIYLSGFFENDAKAIMDDAPADIPIDVAIHVVFLILTSPLWSYEPHEFPASDIALIKKRLLVEYGYVAAFSRFAYLMGILEYQEILTRDEAEECCVIMLREVVASIWKRREI